MQKRYENEGQLERNGCVRDLLELLVERLIDLVSTLIHFSLLVRRRSLLRRLELRGGLLAQFIHILRVVLDGRSGVLDDEVSAVQMRVFDVFECVFGLVLGDEIDEGKTAVTKLTELLGQTNALNAAERREEIAQLASSRLERNVLREGEKKKNKPTREKMDIVSAQSSHKSTCK